MHQTEVHSPHDRFSDNSEELFQRSMVYRTVLYLVRTKNIKHVRNIVLQVFKKTDQHIHSESVWL